MRSLLCLALVFVATAAAAADAPPPIGSIPPEQLIKELDRNGNSCLDLEEGRNYASRRFHILDANGDENVDATEAPPGPMETINDRPISLAAWQDAYHARFAGFDADASGCLSAEEITKGRALLGTGGAQ